MFSDVLHRQEEEKRLRAAGRVPPGQSLTSRFPVLHYGPIPSFDPDQWDFRVWGEVEQEVRWDWEGFQQLPRTRRRMDIHCVTRWSKFETEWEGVSLAALIERGFIKIKPSARYLMQHCQGGYTTNLPLEVALAENFLLATHYSGEPLTLEHGYPVRGVVGYIPGREDLKTPYFWKGGKWLQGLEFMAQDRLGFWEQAGYHNEADIWKEQRTVHYG